MTKFEIKELELTNNGKRNAVLCNGLRGQCYDKVMSVLKDAGFDAVKAANGDIAMPICVDAATGETFSLRLTVSFSSKGLDSKVAKKPATKEAVEIPSIF